MAIWDKLKVELDRAGKAAQNALDEGKVRLEAFRTRQLADKAAQALGYAVYRARKAGAELDAESYARLSATLGTHEEEAARLEQQLRDLGATRPAREAQQTSSDQSTSEQSTSEPPPPPPAADATAPPGPPPV